MSVKATSLVWDLECPQKINDLEFKPGHKFVLVAYADHADHHGRNIWPAVPTIAKKTGYEDRSVQRLTHDLNDMGLLVEDGMGPRGTNKWFIPFNARGDKISPVTNCQGDIDDKSLGDIPSGDIPSGDKLTPELKEPEPNQFNISNTYIDIWGDTKAKLKSDLPKASFETWVQATQAVHFDADKSILWIECRNDYACTWLTKHIQQKSQDITGLYVRFLTVANNELAEIGNE